MMLSMTMGREQTEEAYRQKQMQRTHNSEDANMLMFSNTFDNQKYHHTQNSQGTIHVMADHHQRQLRNRNYILQQQEEEDDESMIDTDENQNFGDNQRVTTMTQQTILSEGSSNTRNI